MQSLLVRKFQFSQPFTSRPPQLDYPHYEVSVSQIRLQPRETASFFLFFIFSCFALRKVSLISAFVIALGVVFCQPFSYAYSFCILVSALRYVIVIVNFCKFVRFIIFSPVQYKVLFLVHVNQSLSCIRSCRTDLVSIVFPVIFARFLSHLLYFKLLFLQAFGPRLLILYFLFFAVIVLVNREVKVEFKLYESVYYTSYLQKGL